LTPVDFVNKNEKHVIAFLWNLMRRVERIGRINQSIDKLPRKLIAWVQNEVGEEYTIEAARDINGDVLAALLHSRRPSLITLTLNVTLTLIDSHPRGIPV